MKIPTDVVPLAESITSRPDGTRTTEPVRYASAGRDALAHSPPKQLQNARVSEPHRTLRSNEQVVEQRDIAADRERRQGERRNGNKPVLLDTRVSQVRRRKAGAKAIDLQA